MTDRIEPATKLPWRMFNQAVFAGQLKTTSKVATFIEPKDAVYSTIAANTHPLLVEALEATPLRAKDESGEDFDNRQTAWLRDYYRPALKAARGEQD